MYQTVPQLFKEVTASHGDVAAQMSKDDKAKFHPISYSALRAEVNRFAAGLSVLGVGRGAHVGLIADNRKEWLVADLAILSLGAADVPRGRDSMPQELQYILSFAGCAITCAENAEQADKILRIKGELPDLKTMIVLDQKFQASDLEVDPGTIAIVPYGEVLVKGDTLLANTPDFTEKEIEKGGIDDLATIIFTSGTTGEPKGVMLNHRSFLHQVKGIPKVVDIHPGDVWLSVLPVWHSFERILQYAALATSSTLAYSKPIGKIMLQDFQKVSPTWMGSVPRIWESVRAGVYRTVQQKGAVSTALFTFFVAVGGAFTTARNMILGRMPRFRYRSRLLDIILAIIPLIILFPFKKLGDVLVFKSIKLKLGGKFRAGVSGGGSLPAGVDTFFSAAGIVLLNGYGLTETGPVIAIRNYFKPIPLTLSPFPETELRIVGEDGKDCAPGKKGIILAKGPQLMMGYYNRQELTDEVLDKDGWLNTGDIGLWTMDGEFDIRGRAKDTIVLFGGENIEPAPIESKLRESEYIEQVMIVGQDEKFLGALVVVDQKAVELYLKDNAVPYEARATMLDMPEVLELINGEIQELVSPKNGFKAFERVYRFAIVEKAFEIGTELSAKQEIRRHVIRDMYKKKIKGIFAT